MLGLLMIEVRNLFAEVPGDSPGEVSDMLFESEGVRIERIVSHSAASPEGFWYDQMQEEWVLMVRGEASLRIHPDQLVSLKAGDHLLIPRHCRHRVEWTAPGTIWLAIHLHSRSGEGGEERRGDR